MLAVGGRPACATRTLVVYPKVMVVCIRPLIPVTTPGPHKREGHQGCVIAPKTPRGAPRRLATTGGALRG